MGFCPLERDSRITCLPVDTATKTVDVAPNARLRDGDVQRDDRTRTGEARTTNRLREVRARAEGSWYEVDCLRLVYDEVEVSGVLSLNGFARVVGHEPTHRHATDAYAESDRRGCGGLDRRLGRRRLGRRRCRGRLGRLRRTGARRRG